MRDLYAAIDIGSNAMRLYIARVVEVDGVAQLQKQNLVRIPIRLGKDVYSKGEISEMRGQMFVDTMMAFKYLLKTYHPDQYVACATAAMREAKNGEKYLALAEKKTGIKVDLIDGLEEARLIRNTSVITDSRDYDLTMFVDVGGGSTEISVLSDKKLIEQRSFKIGTLRMLSGGVKPKQWDALGEWLMQFNKSFGRINFIGSGGNINKLVKLFGRPKENLLIFNNLKYAYSQMKTMALEERISVFNLRTDRADVIVPAAEIFLFIMEHVKAEQVLAPKIGVADGLIFEMYKKQKKNR